MREWLWSKLKALILLPRGHGKTQSCIALFVRHILEIQTPILVITAGSGNARRIFREVKRLLKTPLIREKYGDLIESFSTNTGEMWFSELISTNSPDPIFKVVGQSGEQIGYHSAWIHLEDIIPEEYISEQSNINVRNWFLDVIKFIALRGEKKSRITATGTRKSLEDFYNFLITKQRFEVLHKQSIKVVSGRLPEPKDCEFDDAMRLISIPHKGEYQTLDCPNWELDELLDELINNPVGFASQMQNEPIPRSGLFFTASEWIENSQPMIDFTGNQTFVDPAWGKSAAASESCILVCTVSQGKMVVLDASIGKYDPTILDDEAARLHKLFRGTQIHLEDNFLQITSRFTESSRIMNLRGVRTFEQTIDKIMRIDSLKAPFSTGRIEIHTSCSFKEKIRAQFLKYNRRAGSWDILDCLATAYEFLSYYMRMRREQTIKIGARGNRF
jgi:hypothetical protein